MLKNIELIINIFVIIFSILGFAKIYIFYYKKNNGLKKVLNKEYKNHHFVSIIIPARNEEKRICKLLNSLKNQSYKNFEIIVVDDNSEDNTRQVVENYKSLSLLNNLKYIKLEDEKWHGKSAACHLGASNADGNLLLFLDADLFLSDDALEYLVKYALEDAIISIQPYHYSEKFYEQFSLYCNIIAFLGLDLGNIKNPFKTKSGLFGPCVLIPKKIYQYSQGHLMVKDSILEDMDLGIELSKRNIDLYSIPHKGKFEFRMYEEGFSYLFNGWSKNMVLGAQKSNIFSLLIISSFMTLSLSLPISIIASIVKTSIFPLYLNLTIYFLFAIFLFLVAKKIGSFSFFSCLFFPIFALFYLIIFIRSIIYKIFRIPIDWRGRKVIIG